MDAENVGATCGTLDESSIYPFTWLKRDVNLLVSSRYSDKRYWYVLDESCKCVGNVAAYDSKALILIAFECNWNKISKYANWELKWIENSFGFYFRGSLRHGLWLQAWCERSCNITQVILASEHGCCEYIWRHKSIQTFYSDSRRPVFGERESNHIPRCDNWN